MHGRSTIGTVAENNAGSKEYNKEAASVSSKSEEVGTLRTQNRNS